MTNLTSPIYNNEDAARAHLEGIRWANGVSCPLCGGLDRIAPVKMMSKPSKAKPESTEQPGWYHCGDCRKKFTVRTGTIYERSHVPLHKWVLATQLLCSSKKGMSAHQLHRMIGVTYKTAWFMFHRIREAMLDDSPAPIGGPGKSVQADETYFGTKDSKRGKEWSEKKGHSNKMSVVSLVSEGKARTFHVDNANITTVREILLKNVTSDTELWTDESRLYVRVGKEFADHKTVKHTAGEYVRNGAHVNNAENYFSIFKRGMKGVYQHCSEKHLQRYLTEFDFRYNNREITDFERAEIALKGADGKRLTYRRIEGRKAA
jgi:transposase-like protein